MKPNRNQDRDSFEHDVKTRQRNIVFPDTAANEARFLRNIIYGSYSLTPLQITGIVVVFLMLFTAMYGLFSAQLSLSDVRGTLWQRIVGNFGGLLIPFAVMGLFLIAVKVAVSRSDRKKKMKSERHR